MHTAEHLLIALDVDGTILHHDGHLTPGVADAIRALDELPQVTVVIATGRSVVATLPVMEALGLCTQGRPAVCSNGAVTVEIDQDDQQGHDAGGGTDTHELVGGRTGSKVVFHHWNDAVNPV